MTIPEASSLVLKAGGVGMRRRGVPPGHGGKRLHQGAGRADDPVLRFRAGHGHPHRLHGAAQGREARSRSSTRTPRLPSRPSRPEILKLQRKTLINGRITSVLERLRPICFHDPAVPARLPQPARTARRAGRGDSRHRPFQRRAGVLRHARERIDARFPSSPSPARHSTTRRRRRSSPSCGPAGSPREKSRRPFESEFAAVVGTRHALALNSATAGLHLALEAVGVGPGSVVLTTPYTFAATAEVVRYLGADPVFVDIDRETLNIDAARLGETLGNPCGGRPTRVGDHSRARRRASVRHGCDRAPVAASTASPSSRTRHTPSRSGSRGRYAGTFGDAGVYSFYATKTITTGEGGMVATDRDEVAARIRVMRLHGIDRDVWNRYTAPGASWKYDVVAPGYKYNLTDIAAAIGRVQLSKAEAFLAREEGGRSTVHHGLQRAWTFSRFPPGPKTTPGTSSSSASRRGSLPSRGTSASRSCRRRASGSRCTSSRCT